MLTCPNCKLLNPLATAVCDCGYSFTQNGMSTVPSGPVLASLSDRFFAQIIDTLIAFIPLAIASPIIIISETGGFLAIVAAIALGVAYVLFADGLRCGQSFGKRLLGISVINADTGHACSFGESFLRNLLLTVLGWIDWIFILGRRRQRLGDRAARTIVIKGIAC